MACCCQRELAISPLPFIVPCAPKPVKSPPAGDWLHEPKLDGWRCIAVKRGKDVTLYSRHGKDITQRFKAVATALAALPVKSLTLDGELVVAGEDGIDFYGLLGKTRAGAVLMAFDILERDGKDLRALPLIERKAHLLKALAKAKGGRRCTDVR